MSRLKFTSNPLKRKNSIILSIDTGWEFSDKLDHSEKPMHENIIKQENPLSMTSGNSSSKPSNKKESSPYVFSTPVGNKRSKFSVSKTKLPKPKKLIANKIAADFSTGASKINIQKTFKTVIKNDKVFGKILSKIKDFFDKLLQKMKTLAAPNHTLQTQITHLKSSIQEEILLHNQINNKIDKFQRENQDLNHELHDKESKYIEMQDQLIKISQLDLSDLTLTQDLWEKLVDKNQIYSQACKDLKSENKEFWRKEKKMLKLVLALKRRGIPVGEVYENEVRNSKQRRYPRNKFETEEVEDDTENENIVEGPPLVVTKPQIIPTLNIQPKEYQTSGESSYYSSLPNLST